MVVLLPFIEGDNAKLPKGYDKTPEHEIARMFLDEICRHNLPLYEEQLITVLPIDKFPYADLPYMNGREGTRNSRVLSEDLQVEYWIGRRGKESSQADYGELACIYAPLEGRTDGEEIDSEMARFLHMSQKPEEAVFAFTPGDKFRRPLSGLDTVLYVTHLSCYGDKNRRVMLSSDIESDIRRQRAKIDQSIRADANLLRGIEAKLRSKKIVH